MFRILLVLMFAGVACGDDSGGRHGRHGQGNKDKNDKKPTDWRVLVEAGQAEMGSVAKQLGAQSPAELFLKVPRTSVSQPVEDSNVKNQRQERLLDFLHILSNNKCLASLYIHHFSSRSDN